MQQLPQGTRHFRLALISFCHTTYTLELVKRHFGNMQYLKGKPIHSMVIFIVLPQEGPRALKERQHGNLVISADHDKVAASAFGWEINWKDFIVRGSS